VTGRRQSVVTGVLIENPRGRTPQGKGEAEKTAKRATKGSHVQTEKTAFRNVSSRKKNQPGDVTVRQKNTRKQQKGMNGSPGSKKKDSPAPRRCGQLRAPEGPGVVGDGNVSAK